MNLIFVGAGFSLRSGVRRNLAKQTFTDATTLHAHSRAEARSYRFMVS
jgi:hypothetical protein